MSPKTKETLIDWAGALLALGIILLLLQIWWGE
jgi:hypothetical protein